MADANQETIARLLAGETVTIRPRGNSMLPKIKSGTVLLVAPVNPDAPPQPGDIVLARVAGNTYCHYVSAVKGSGDKTMWQISNASGHVNGWTKSVYGVIVEIGFVPKP